MYPGRTFWRREEQVVDNGGEMFATSLTEMAIRAVTVRGVAQRHDLECPWGGIGGRALHAGTFRAVRQLAVRQAPLQNRRTEPWRCRRSGYEPRHHSQRFATGR